MENKLINEYFIRFSMDIPENIERDRHYDFSVMGCKINQSEHADKLVSDLESVTDIISPDGEILKEPLSLQHVIATGDNFGFY